MKFVVKNLSNLQPTPDWASLPLFDRTEWKRVRFGDVVENCNETCGPAEAGLERFVAMEHLEPGSLHVRSWGNVADGTTFTRRCRPGQVLFGKRRAYQRKVAEMRRKLSEADRIECVLGLGPNLFYNSPMEACVVVCPTQKPKARRGKILFINAVNEVTRERTQSFLTDEHLQRVVRAYQDFKDEPGFTRVVPIEEIRAKEGNLSIPLYVGGETQAQTDAAIETATTALPGALSGWLESSAKVHSALSSLLSAEGGIK